MSHCPEKKNTEIKKLHTTRTVGEILLDHARFARPNLYLYTDYFHNSDIWDKVRIELKQQMRKKAPSNQINNC